MAKSKENSQQEIREQLMKPHCTALYCRLSKGDKKRDNVYVSESESIQNQRKMLWQYAVEHNFPNPIFYVDEDESGVYFDRPELMRMLADIREGKIKIVVTKDLSRLGRDYLETGSLIEKFFPEWNVRYIAIQENVDTYEDNDGFYNLLPIRNYFNEFYARETSKKVRAVKLSKAKRGERASGGSIYGYLQDGNEKNHLVLDYEVCDVVYDIFYLYSIGETLGNIREFLKKRKILSPANLIKQRNNQQISKNPYDWNNKMLHNLLSSEEYLGTMVTAKTEKERYNSKKVLINSDEKRFFFPNAHEPIVDEELFEKAKNRLVTRHKPTAKKELDILSGLLFCADCGKKMNGKFGYKSVNEQCYVCGNYRNNKQCTPHTTRRFILHDLVEQEIVNVLNYLEKYSAEFLKKSKQEIDKKLEGLVLEKEAEHLKISERTKEIDLVFRTVYEDRLARKISEEQFQYVLQNYTNEKNELQDQFSKICYEISELNTQKENPSRFLKLARKYSDWQGMTFENVHELVEKIIIHDRNENNKLFIEIQFRFYGIVDYRSPKPTDYASSDRLGDVLYVVKSRGWF